MKLEDETILSFYQDIEKINNRSDLFLVKHVESQKLFIKKILSKSAGEIYRQLQELHAFGVPEIYHVIDDEDDAVIIEEFINEDTLSERLQTTGLFSLEEATAIIIRLCEILSQFHNAKSPIIHRDIKPSNILVDSEGNITLIDFDASKFYESAKNKDTVLMGTAGFAAPEQYGFAQSDARTDIYALGVLYNVLLTGDLPTDKLYSGFNSEIIERCTCIDPNNRYQDLSQLRAALTGHPVTHSDVNEFSPADSEKNKSRARRFIPPGFRSGSVLKMLIASFVYLAIILFCLTTSFNNVESPAERILDKIISLLGMMSFIFWFFDWGGVSSQLPVSGSKNQIVSYLGRFMWFAATIFAMLFLASIILT